MTSATKRGGGGGEEGGGGSGSVPLGGVWQWSVGSCLIITVCLGYFL